MKNVLITGSNRGIGLAFARAYLKRGDVVIATCRHPVAAASLHELQSVYPDRLAILPLDVGDPEQIAACRAEVAGQWGSLHLLINNAGILRHAQRVSDIGLDDLMDSFRINAAGPLMVATAHADLLSAGAPARLVNITMPTPPISRWTRTDNQIYVASRYALNALTKMMALEFQDRGITTVGLYPGYIQTDMNEHASSATPAGEGIPAVVDLIETLTPEYNGLALLPDGSVYGW